MTDKKMTKGDWKKIILDIDENGDGQISFEEFSHLMKEVILGTPDYMNPKEKNGKEQAKDYSLSEDFE